MTSKKFYETIYDNLCESRKANIDYYKPYSGLHKHHITPSHSGGEDVEQNFTYLTVREHIIAHYLLWKIYKNPNDLRQMNMLGAKLTSQHRITVGKWCHENKIGFHKFSREEKSSMAKRQREIRIETDTQNEWDFWAQKEGRTLRSQIGGKIGGKTTKERKVGWFTEDTELRSKWGSNAAKFSAKLPVYDTVNKIIKKFHTAEERQQFLLLNQNFIKGSGPYAEHRLDRPRKSFFAYEKYTFQKVNFYSAEERNNFVQSNPNYSAGRKPRKS